jgi:hypothetical protein
MAATKKKPQIMYEPDEMLRRAMAAWFRTGGSDQPGRDASTIEEAGGKDYVVLRNVNGVMAVYRIRNDCMLKRLRRWPEEIE